MAFFVRKPTQQSAFFREWFIAKETFFNFFPIVSLPKKFWSRQGLLTLFGLIFIPLGLLNPYFTQLAVDGPLMNKSMQQFVQIGFWMGLISLVTMLLQNYRTYLQGRLSVDAREYITQKIYFRLTAMSLDYFRRKDRHVNAGVVGGDGSEVAVKALSLIPEIGMAALVMLAKVAMVFWIDWRLGVVASLSPPLYAVQTLLLARRNREIATAEREAGFAYSKELGDCIGNIDLVKAFRTEKYHNKKFILALKKLSSLWIGNQRFALYFGWISGLMKKVFDGLPVLLASFLVARGELSLGQMMAGIIYTSQFVASYTALLDFIPTVSTMAVSANVFTEFLKTRPSVSESPRAKEVVFSKGEILVENVSFSYVPEVPVLQDVSLKIEGGRWTGLKAPSGFGKTTLLNLILRMYDPHKGTIRLEGHDVRDIKFRSMKDQLGAVLQQPFLTREPIWKCIAYDMEDVTRKEIEEAAKIAGIHEQIIRFSEGYETSSGDLGLKLSQGQRQRIAIARALVRKPKILIMDEAFNSVDKETEDLIFGDMRNAFPRITVIVVSHHQSILDKMDRIIDLTRSSAMKLPPETSSVLS